MSATSGATIAQFKSSADLREMLSVSAKRNSMVAAVCCLFAFFVGIAFDYGIAVQCFALTMSFIFLVISRKTTVDNFRVQERMTFVLSTFMVIGLLFISQIVTTLVVFLPCLSYLFLLERNKTVRWATLAAILTGLLVSSGWFFPELTLSKSSYELRYEAIFDVLLAAIFTGVFVRFHMDIMQHTVASAEQQTKNHEKYIYASKVAYDSLAGQKVELDTMHESARSALLNERLVHAQIAASQDQLEQFAYAASHDLKEPIRTIRSFLQVVRRRLPAEVIDEEGLAEHFEFVEQSSVAMHQLLERLLVYSRIEKASLSKKSISIVSVLQRLGIDKTLGLGESGAQVSVTLPDGHPEPKLLLNPEHAMTIFKELFCNSILFRSTDRPLKICIEVDIVDEGNLLVTFDDNGIGIEDQYHEQVFGLFKRLNAREDYPGSGLGLSLVRSILDASGGQVSLSSTLGEGTQVHLLLPRMVAE